MKNQEQETAMYDQPIVSDDEIIENMPDRELLEYIAKNMVTTEQVIKTVSDNIPVWVARLQTLSEEYPFLKTILRFMK